MTTEEFAALVDKKGRKEALKEALEEISKKEILTPDRLAEKIDLSPLADPIWFYQWLYKWPDKIEPKEILEKITKMSYLPKFDLIYQDLYITRQKEAFPPRIEDTNKFFPSNTPFINEWLNEVRGKGKLTAYELAKMIKLFSPAISYWLLDAEKIPDGMESLIEKRIIKGDETTTKDDLIEILKSNIQFIDYIIETCKNNNKEREPYWQQEKVSHEKVLSYMLEK